MKIEVVEDIEGDPRDVLVWVSDLNRFPQWTQLLHRVEVDAASPDTWQVELRGKIGPFARSKRLRMIRVPTTATDHVRFERLERDGQEHGAWNLDVRVRPGSRPKSTRVTVTFEYEGRLWSGAIERLLRDEIESSKRRLARLVADDSQRSDQAL